jgi:phosphoribosylglycinamide formyltransferase-1
MKNIAIFASGQGTNANAIIQYFKNHSTINVALVVSNNPSAGVINIAHQQKIMSAIVSKETFNNEPLMMKLLNGQHIQFIALAGFLQLIPLYLTSNYSKRIVNIHPALLPKHGGKGMYGNKVHEAVIKSGDTETGFTIHYVNDKYDEGEIILQKKVSIESHDNAQSITKKVLELEHQWYPATIEKLLH